MSDIENMTPDELRALADEMDDAKPWEKRVTVRGVELVIDMRVLKDVRTMRLIRAADKGGVEGAFSALELFDAVLGDQTGKVEEALSKDGFCDSDDYTEFCIELINEVGAKN